MKNLRFILFFTVIILMTGIPMSQAVTLDIVDGQLHGANDVLVNDISYDVQFKDGNTGEFDDGTYRFMFTSSDDANLASQALLDSVFDDTSLGMFDTIPSLINGIDEDDSMRPNSHILTFYDVEYNTDYNSWFASTAFNAVVEKVDQVGSWQADGGLDTTSYNSATLAIWSLHTIGESIDPPGDDGGSATVPEPATMLLFGIGLLGLAGVNRKKA